MILTINDLPSGGKFGHVAPLNLRPLTFIEMLEYNNDVAGTSIKSYLKDIKWLEKMDKGILNHSLYDLDYIIFMMKVHTISDDKEFSTDVKCSCGNKIRVDFDLSSFKFKDVNAEEIEVQNVLLGGFKYKVKVPRISDFLNVVNKYNLYNKVSQIDVVKIISMFPEFKAMPNDVENAVLNANRDEISILYTIEDRYLSSVKPISVECPHCDKVEGMTIGIGSLIVDMFRDVLLNNPVTESKIQFN